MNECCVIELPVDWADEDCEFYLVPEGEYQVLVERVTNEPDGRVVVEMKILDDGPSANKRLFASYSLSTKGGKYFFKEFLEAIRVRPEGNRLPVSACRNKLLDVTVKHNACDGKTYANVVAHRACVS